MTLLGLGLRREKNVLLLMHDCNDWPVSFLGALYAGVVPVTVNTLLTADDYAYMLEHSRSQAVLVSGALLPTLDRRTGQVRPRGQKVIVSRPQAPLPAEVAFRCLWGRPDPQAKPAAPCRRSNFWLYSSGSTGHPGAPCIRTATLLDGGLYGRRAGLTEDDVCFSAAAVFAYGLGNGLTFPPGVGPPPSLMADGPPVPFTRWLGKFGPGGCAPAPRGSQAGRPVAAQRGSQTHRVFGAPTGFAGMLAHPALPARATWPLRLVSSAGEALPAELGERSRPTSAWTLWTASAPPKCCTSSCQHPQPRALRHHRLAGAGL